MTEKNNVLETVFSVRVSSIHNRTMQMTAFWLVCPIKTAYMLQIIPRINFKTLHILAGIWRWRGGCHGDVTSHVAGFGEVAANDGLNGGVGGGYAGHGPQHDDLDVHHLHPQGQPLATTQKENQDC